MNKTIYETDFNKWVEQTVNQLKNRKFEELDLENLIEEVADLSGKDKKKLNSLLTRLLEHLLKIKYWTSERDFCLRGWLSSRTQLKLTVKLGNGEWERVVEVLHFFADVIFIYVHPLSRSKKLSYSNKKAS